MKTYTPNIHDPRVQKRIYAAYGWARAHLSSKPKTLAKSFIDANLGSQNHDLSRWLRDRLLFCTNNFYSEKDGITKEYILNAEKAGEVKLVVKWLLEKEDEQSMVGEFSPPPLFSMCSTSRFEGNPEDLFDYRVVRDWALREHGEELKSGIFTYADKSSRLWNGLQNVRSKFRQALLDEFGYAFDYDVQASAPTLILQHAQHQGMDLWLPALQEYIADRTKHRVRLAALTGCTEKQIKVVINAFFCGARLGANRDYSLFWALDGNRDAIKALQADEWVTELRENIKTCWEAIEPTLTKITVTNPKTGKERKVPLNSKRKWAVYFNLERQVLNAAREYLTKTGNENFLLHDGFTSKKPVVTTELQNFIEQKTGFKVKFEQS